MSLEVIGLDHLYVTVSNFQRSQAFYDAVMELLGFKKGDLLTPRRVRAAAAASTLRRGA